MQVSLGFSFAESRLRELLRSRQIRKVTRPVDLTRALRVRHHLMKQTLNGVQIALALWLLRSPSPRCTSF